MEKNKRELSEMAYRVTQENATEPPFRNEYWDHFAKGLYVDVVTGEPLFTSSRKFDSGCGWPAFDAALEDTSIHEVRDTSIPYMPRTEVRSRGGHLGHVFPDEPTATGLRYCINSAALRFIPYEELEAAGYGTYRQIIDAEEAENGK